MPASSDGDLIRALKDRFLGHGHRHPGLDWTKVEARLLAAPA